MKKQSKKTKTDTSKKRGRPAKKAQKQTTKQQPETEQPEDKTVTEEEQNNHEVTENQEIESKKTENKKTENQPLENTEQTSQTENKEPDPEDYIEPQSKVPDNPETDLNQSQIQALRSRFSYLTKDHFEGGTAIEVLQHLAEVTNTDINELKVVAKAWEQPPQNPII